MKPLVAVRTDRAAIWPGGTRGLEWARGVIHAADTGTQEPCWHGRHRICLQPAKAAGLCPDHLEEFRDG